MKFSHLYLKQFTSSLFQKIGCSLSDSEIIADVLITAELRGISSHGMIRISDYIELWEQGRINTSPDIKITHETPSTAVVDGDRSLGMLAAYKSMKIAIAKAKNVGTGWVSTRNSNHFSIAGYYAMMALEEDMIGITMTNANPLVAPTFSISRLLGTNPIAVAIPTGKQPSFVADFATTPIARGKLAILGRKGEPCVTGYVQDKDGKESTNPDILKEKGAMLTLGGDSLHGSHKGYCMSSVVDIFSAVLSGANFGPFVPPSVPYLPVLDKKVGDGTGHFFGAMRIDAFQDAKVFKKQMDIWIETFRSAERIDKNQEVLIPGDIERKIHQEKLNDGIEILSVVVDDLKKIAEKYSIEFNC